MGLSECCEEGETIFEIIVSRAYERAGPRKVLELPELARFMNDVYDIDFTPKVILRLNQMHEADRGRPLIQEVGHYAPPRYERYSGFR
jgi:hypothetical protein